MSGSHERRIVIVGAGGFGRETASALGAGAATGGPRPVGFLDDASELAGATIAGLPVLGGLDQIDRFLDCDVVLTIGSPRNYGVKRLLADRFGAAVSYATVVHRMASVGAQTVLGEGTVLLAGVVVTQGVHIGRHVGVMPNVVMTHDDTIGDYATIGAGTTLAGAVTVGEGAYVGSGVSVREHVAIGAGSLIGMGSVVLGDVPPGETWAGAPARRLA